jgi:hypothetical protein
MDVHGAGPQLLRADACERDGRLAVHAGCLCGVRIEPIAGDDAHAIVFPAGERCSGHDSSEVPAPF